MRVFYRFQGFVDNEMQGHDQSQEHRPDNPAMNLHEEFAMALSLYHPEKER